MGASRRPAEQTRLIEDHLPSYLEHLEKDTLKFGFWPGFEALWFERWPIPEPTPELIEKEKTLEKAQKSLRTKQVSKIRRIFKNIEDAARGGKCLHLDKDVPRKRSEVQVYMSMYYDSRIRQAVLDRWVAEGYAASINFRGSDIPEDLVDPEDSALLKDTTIPINYKNTVARDLYKDEDEDIKEAVKERRDEDFYAATVYSALGEDRKELIRAYQRNISALPKNLVTILRNAERKCAAKGIIWLACPTPSRGGTPVGQFHCVGSTADGQDFEAFVGAEKAEEIKSLFSSWIHAIYPKSDWHLFTTNTDGASAAASETVSGPIDDAISSTIESFCSPDELSSSSSQSDIPPDTSTLAPNVPNPASDQPGSPAIPPSLAISQPDSATSMLPEVDADTPSPLPATTRPSSPLVAEPKRVVTGKRLHTNPAPSNATTLSKAVRSPSPVPGRLEDGPAWMEAKGTLGFFRNTFKAGKLSDVIKHWFELERLLGFQETTPKGFPIKQRPPVVKQFYKDAHSYTKDYGLEVHTLGRQITTWWTEICPPGGEPKVRFGGPTGISTFVVLLSWWWSQLRNRPDREWASCLSVLGDVDRVFSEAINDIKNPSVSVASASQSQPTPSRSRKRANADGASGPQKRLRVG